MLASSISALAMESASRRYDVLRGLRGVSVTVSIGDGSPALQRRDHRTMSELLLIGELADTRARDGCKLIIEGPGRVPLDQWPT